MKYTGAVIHGLGEASVTYALPTANISIDGAIEGVYIGRTMYRGYPYPSLICIRTTRDGQILETHLFDFEGDLYYETLDVEVGERIRDLVPYASPEAMCVLIQNDIAEAQRRLNITLS